MKTTTFLFLLIYLSASTHAQNYLITFAGTGAATTVDSIKVENLMQCTDTFILGSGILNLSATVGINSFSDEETASLNIYPNPTAGSCTATLEAPANGNTTIEILDVIGKRIAQKHQFLSKGKHSFNIQGIGSGVYLLKIQSEKYTCTAKLISNSETTGNLAIKETTAITHIPSSLKLKDSKNTIAMNYQAGDRLKFTGYSGIYKTVFMLVATKDSAIIFNFIPCTDADNNNYAVVQIGTQVWMVENLKTTTYSNGDPLPNVSDSLQWCNVISGEYCHYNNDISNVTVYGELYNWYAVDDTRNICPAGWHAPTDAEWTILENYLGGWQIAGGKLKENCSNIWQSPNLGATNESGFTGLPGGHRVNGLFWGDYNGYWWTSTESVPGWTAWYRDLNYNYSGVGWFDTSLSVGHSVRCLMD